MVVSTVLGTRDGGEVLRLAFGDWLRHPLGVVEGGHAGAVVRDPEGPRWTFGDAPGIDQVGVEELGYPRQVGHQVGLQDIPRQEAAVFEGLYAGPEGRSGGRSAAGCAKHELPPQ